MKWSVTTKVPRVTIDGKTTEVEKGTTVFQAAKKLDIFIPHFCYHPGLSIAGNCRMCLVEIEKVPKLQISCATVCTDNMIVFTNTPKVQKAQKGVLEFILINHPIDCPICDQAGECVLQDNYYKVSGQPSRFKDEKVHKEKVLNLGKEIILDQERCILCTRCVRFMREVAKSEELGVFGRGDHSYINTFPEEKLKSDYAGNIVDICPVGALTNENFRFQCRVWFAITNNSICTKCSRGCNIVVDIRGRYFRGDNPQSRILRIRPRYNQEVNNFWICDEGRFGLFDTDYTTRIKKSVVNKTQYNLVDAIMQTVKKIKEIKPEEISILFNTTLSLEEVFSLKTFIGELNIKNVNYQMFVTEDNDHDLILRRTDTSPNTHGINLLNFLTIDKTEIIKKIDSGQIKLLLIIGEGEDFKKLESELTIDFINKNVVFIGTHLLPDSKLNNCRIIFPLSSFMEKNGTFVNFQKRLQKFNQVFSPLGDALPLTDILSQLSKELKIKVLSGSAEYIFTQMTETIDELQNLTHQKIGDNGIPLN